ncbi:Crp/Fnr family transcriptional regulator [Sphingomonas profundi]|uniref:Crp/Fnr family transcriptional regulator n=1 Tax=Alterirhizorhabdus profundi TaxID=2681549 RepID=UPI0012E79F8F|nr:Crp/Fnr family transcriptional regulator [Sphingomonas profundi]
MTRDTPLLLPMVQKLQQWKPLDEADRDAILALPCRAETLRPGGYIVRQGDSTTTSCLLVSGVAFRQKVVDGGGRSILAIHMRGDIVDLQNSLLRHADHSVQALTKIDVAFIPREAIVDVAFRFPNVGLAMWYDTLVDGSIFREWIASNSRRDALSRLAHLLCEFGLRMEAAGLADRLCYELPMTQDQLADALGLTPIHVNRTLKRLEELGLISRTQRSVTVTNWANLARVGDFSCDYLHLPASTPD